MKGKGKSNLTYTTRPGKQMVCFEYIDGDAARVCVAGTFNGWQPPEGEMTSNGRGKWVRELELAPGTYEYRFVVDGRWITDPKCPRTAPNPFGDVNSVLEVTAPVRKAAPRRKAATAAQPLMRS